MMMKYRELNDELIQISVPNQPGLFAPVIL